MTKMLEEDERKVSEAWLRHDYMQLVPKVVDSIEFMTSKGLWSEVLEEPLLVIENQRVSEEDRKVKAEEHTKGEEVDGDGEEREKKRAKLAGNPESEKEEDSEQGQNEEDFGWPGGDRYSNMDKAVLEIVERMFACEPGENWRELEKATGKWREFGGKLKYWKGLYKNILFKESIYRLRSKQEQVGEVMKARIKDDINWDDHDTPERSDEYWKTSDCRGRS